MNWEPPDIIVAILAASVSISLIITLVSAHLSGEPLSADRSKNLATITIAVLAIVSLYIGAKLTGSAVPPP